jgi:phosphatidylinositol alpha-1,6-mannosyltransferase
LVPRNGFDIVIDAVRELDGVQLAIAGSGRDRKRLERRAQGRAHFLGRVADDELPALYACADVFAMCCHDRWGGLEAEGFGIVFLEAAACGVPSVAGRSGGSHEAVVDGETGYVVEPRSVPAVREAIRKLCTDGVARAEMGVAARRRAVDVFAYDHLVAGLQPLTRGDLSSLRSLQV